MHDDITTLRRSILALDKTKQRRRYPASLRKRLASYVLAHPERSALTLARKLDMAPQTLERFVAGASPMLVPVRVVDDVSPSPSSAIVVRGPRGIVVEGLDVTGVAELMKALA
jgi:hypothetical protein